MKRIEFGELRIGDVARKHIQDVIDSNWASAGPKVKLLEQEWSCLFGYKHSLAVSSGTDACLNGCLSLYDFGAERGDEIITPALSYIATTNAIVAAGFTPIFVDIDRRTLNIDHKLIEDKISPRTRAIQVVHTMGRPCEMSAIMFLAAKHKLKVLEDCCEAHGATFQGRTVGRFGHAAAFSFYIAHLVCCGEGGMVSTMHDDVANVLKSTRSHGRRNGELYFDFPRRGLNSKMNDLEAAIGLEAVDCFWQTFDTRRATVKRIRAGLAQHEDKVWFSEEDEGNRNCPHGFSLTVKDPAMIRPLCDHLDEKSIHWKRNFGSIPTQHGAFAYLGHRFGDFPEAEYVGTYGIHIGVHQHLSDADIAYVIESIDEFFRR